MSKADCGRHGTDWCSWNKHYRCALYVFLGLCVLVGIFALIIFLVLRPKNPTFALQNASIVDFELSSTNLLTSTFRITLFSRNPNHRVGVYYDSLAVYAAYKDQQITLSTMVPPSYLGRRDVSVWSPYLYGVSVPIAQYLAVSLAQEEDSGVLLLHVKIDGRLRWKVGTWRSGKHQLNVNCPAIFRYKKTRGSDGLITSAFSHPQLSKCTVDV